VAGRKKRKKHNVKKPIRKEKPPHQKPCILVDFEERFRN
jgi:hypothetical protein